MEAAGSYQSDLLDGRVGLGTPGAHPPGAGADAGPSSAVKRGKGGEKVRAARPLGRGRQAKGLLFGLPRYSAPDSGPGRISRQNAVGPRGFGGSSCQLGFRAVQSAGGGAYGRFWRLRGRRAAKAKIPPLANMLEA
jgi:hypothetical protein